MARVEGARATARGAICDDFGTARRRAPRARAEIFRSVARRDETAS